MYLAEEAAEQVLAQTIAFLAGRGDHEGVRWLLNVRFLTFEQAGSGFLDADDQLRHSYAAVFHVESELAPQFTDQVRKKLVKVLARVAERNGQDSVDRIRVEPSLPDVEALRVYRCLKLIQSGAPPDRAIAITPSSGARLPDGYAWAQNTIVFGNGRAVVFEIEGPPRRGTSHLAEDRERELRWERCGIPVVRLPVEGLAGELQLVDRLGEELLRHLWPDQPPAGEGRSVVTGGTSGGLL